MKTSKVKSKEDWVSRQLSDGSIRLSFDQERAAHEFIEQFEVALCEAGLSRAEVARRLGRSAPSITQALRKGRNLTIKLMTELAGICDHEVHIRLRPRSSVGGPIYIEPERDWSATHVSETSSDCDASQEALLRDLPSDPVRQCDEDSTGGVFHRSDTTWENQVLIRQELCCAELPS
jgi:transcriptional regulator with XRE-family HTH domain